MLDKIYATHGHGVWKKKLMINDRIADSIFQQVVTRADEYTVLATADASLSVGVVEVEPRSPPH